MAGLVRRVLLGIPPRQARVAVAEALKTQAQAAQAATAELLAVAREEAGLEQVWAAQAG